MTVWINKSIFTPDDFILKPPAHIFGPFCPNWTVEAEMVQLELGDRISRCYDIDEIYGSELLYHAEGRDKDGYRCPTTCWHWTMYPLEERVWMVLRG